MSQLHRGMGGTAPQPTPPPPQLSSPARTATGEDIAFRVLAADNQPTFRTISDFRKIHLKTLEGLFEQVLKIALEAGALKVGRVALDGTKIKANASKPQAMSYDRMKKKKKDLRSQIKDLVAQTEAADAATPVPDPCDTPPRRRMIRRKLNRPTQ